jgi:hypothetical protein
MTNPLSQYFRQPAIYLRLPSQGTYWNESSIEIPITGELPVMPMTAMDDLALKTPDALFNGTGVVNLIQSCCPSIKNAWDVPSVDLDSILIAIRIASYGETLDFESRCPGCSETNTYEMNLTSILDSIKVPDFETPVEIDQLRIFIKPQTYKHICQAGVGVYEEQQAIRLISNPDIGAEERQQLFDNQLKKIHDITINTVANSTRCVETPDGSSVSDFDYIREFYSNAGNQVIQKVKSRLEILAQDQTVKTLEVTCNECQKPFKTKFEFDYSSFFGQSS